MSVTYPEGDYIGAYRTQRYWSSFKSLEHFSLCRLNGVETGIRASRKRPLSLYSPVNKRRWFA